LTLTAYASDALIGRHAHGFAKISLFLAGTAIETRGAADRHCGVTTVLIKPAGLDHCDRFGPAGARVMSLRCRRRGDQVGESWSRACGEYRALDGGPLSTALARLWACWGDDGDDDEMENRAWETVEQATAVSTDQPASVGPVWVARVTEALHESYAGSVSVSRLAAQVDAHPVYLARAFRRRHGCSIREYLHRLRVRRAADLLNHSDMSLAHVAAESGFCDQPHLSRIFKAHLGVTPAAYRRRIR
jgi:AraC family transcriptional regulator